MNIVLFTWLTIAVCYICTSYAQESNCEVYDGKPNIIKKNLENQDSAQNCSEACEAETQCLLWEYNETSKKCLLSVFKKAKGHEHSSFGIKNCNSPTTCPTCPPSVTCPATSCSNCKACKNGWSSYNGFCYKVFSESFPDQYHAKARCESEGAELATIHSSQEMNFVKDLLDGSSVQYNAWIAGTDADSEGSWEWSQGCPVTYFNWKSGEPSNSFNNEDCLVVWKPSGWKWNDFTCSWEVGGAVCKTTD